MDGTFNGRVIVLVYAVNTSNLTVNFVNQSASATAGQVFYLTGNANVNVLSQGSITFVYSSALAAWIQIGKT
jgi:ethanolamine utilization protein EutQ (cupin superfamily)